MDVTVIWNGANHIVTIPSILPCEELKELLCSELDANILMVEMRHAGEEITDSTSSMLVSGDEIYLELSEAGEARVSLSKLGIECNFKSLTKAICENNKQACFLIIKGDPTLASHAESKGSILSMCVVHNKLELMSELITGDYNIDPVRQDRFGNTALHAAAVAVHGLPFVKLILLHPSATEAMYTRNRGGYLPLGIGSTPAIRELILNSMSPASSTNPGGCAPALNVIRALSVASPTC